MVEEKANSHSQCLVCNRCTPPVHCGGGRGRDRPAERKERVLRFRDKQMEEEKRDEWSEDSYKVGNKREMVKVDETQIT